MKEILLTKGKKAIVSDCDYDYLMTKKWHARLSGVDNCYAQTKKTINGKNITFQMHRVILNNFDFSFDIDHIDGNGLNNQRENLRLCTKSQNHMNRKSNSNSTSKYKGVCWNSGRNKFMAAIRPNGKNRFLGLFDNEIDAAKQYDIYAYFYFGEYARLNFPNDLTVALDNKVQLKNDNSL